MQEAEQALLLEQEARARQRWITPAERLANELANVEVKGRAEERRARTLRPRGAARRTWDAIMLLVVSAALVGLPVGVAFFPRGALVTYGAPLFFAFALDAAVSARTGYECRGAVVREPALVLRHYAQTRLPLDALAVVPILVPHPPRFLPLLGLAKVFTAGPPSFSLLDDGLCATVGSLTARIVELILLFVCVANGLACAWFSVQLRAGLHSSWICTANPDLAAACDAFGAGSSEARSHLWVAAFYWASSAGDGFDTTTTDERICAIVGQILVVNLFGAFIISSILSALETYDTPFVRHGVLRRKLDAVDAYMRSQPSNFPSDLRGRIHAYYRHVWLRQQFDVTEATLLDELPADLRTAVMGHITREFLERNRFFSDYDVSERAVRLLGERLVPRCFAPGELVVREGDVGEELWLVKSGALAVEVASSGVVATMGAGDYFGEAALLTPDATRSASVRASTFSELFSLSRDTLDAAWETLPSMRERMEDVAKQRLTRSATLARPASGAA